MDGDAGEDTRAAARLHEPRGVMGDPVVIAEVLGGDGPARDEAVFWLRAHLAGAASFALGRLGVADDGSGRAKAASLVRDATEAALTAVLADLGRYRGQSAFTTWTAKYAIHEVVAAAWKNGIER